MEPLRVRRRLTGSHGQDGAPRAASARGGGSAGGDKRGDKPRNYLAIDKFAVYCSARLGEGIILILDEIQWIAKKRSGFVSQLKESWLAWEKLEKTAEEPSSTSETPS